MTIRAVIVDDELRARRRLRALLSPHTDVTVVAEARNIDDAAGAVRDHDPDVVFLDIQLRGATGFDLFEHVQVRGAVIFVTAHDEHAIRAFEVNALDYLLKPVSAERLQRALQRLRRESPPPMGGELRENDRVCVRVDRGQHFIDVGEITHITAADDYSELHLRHSKTLLCTVGIKQWIARLPSTSFVQIHRGTVVNTRYVERIKRAADGPGWVIELTGAADPLAVSRRLARSVRERLSK